MASDKQFVCSTKVSSKNKECVADKSVSLPDQPAKNKSKRSNDATVERRSRSRRRRREGEQREKEAVVAAEKSERRSRSRRRRGEKEQQEKESKSRKNEPASEKASKSRKQKRSDIPKEAVAQRSPSREPHKKDEQRSKQSSLVSDKVSRSDMVKEVAADRSPSVEPQKDEQRSAVARRVSRRSGSRERQKKEKQRKLENKPSVEVLSDASVMAVSRKRKRSSGKKNKADTVIVQDTPTKGNHCRKDDEPQATKTEDIDAAQKARLAMLQQRLTDKKELQQRLTDKKEQARKAMDAVTKLAQSEEGKRALKEAETLAAAVPPVTMRGRSQSHSSNRSTPSHTKKRRKRRHKDKQQSVNEKVSASRTDAHKSRKSRAASPAEAPVASAASAVAKRTSRSPSQRQRRSRAASPVAAPAAPVAPAPQAVANRRSRSPSKHQRTSDRRRRRDSGRRRSPSRQKVRERSRERRRSRERSRSHDSSGATAARTQSARTNGGLSQVQSDKAAKVRQAAAAFEARAEADAKNAATASVEEAARTHALPLSPHVPQQVNTALPVTRQLGLEPSAVVPQIGDASKSGRMPAHDQNQMLAAYLSQHQAQNMALRHGDSTNAHSAYPGFFTAQAPLQQQQGYSATTSSTAPAFAPATVPILASTVAQQSFPQHFSTSPAVASGVAVSSPVAAPPPPPPPPDRTLASPPIPEPPNTPTAHGTEVVSPPPPPAPMPMLTQVPVVVPPPAAAQAQLQMTAANNELARPPGAGGSGKGKGKGKGKSGMPRQVLISKALSKILRHTAASLGLHMRTDGSCYVKDVLAVPEIQSYECTIEELQALVCSNDKARFELSQAPDGLLIRAVQGHSMKAVVDEEAMQRLSASDADLPRVCVHGTYRRNWAGIQNQGLIPGGGYSNRNHIHFAPFEPGDGRVISGMRNNCEVAIYIDLRRALQDGIPFFRSANGVILSPGVLGKIDTRYFTQVKEL